MSSRAVIFIDEQDKPTNIPDLETIVQQCFALGPQQATDTNISGVRIDLDKTSVHDVSTIWVKFGAGITMGEANTQRYVSQYLQRHDNMSLVVRVPRVYLAFTWGCFGFIVGEFIDGQTCDASDTPLIVAAVQALITIPSPGPKPGRIGGGLMEHPFFWNWVASKEYESTVHLKLRDKHEVDHEVSSEFSRSHFVIFHEFTSWAHEDRHRHIFVKNFVIYHEVFVPHHEVVAPGANWGSSWSQVFTS